MSTKRKPAAAVPRRPRGRPSKFTPELAAEICERLSEGDALAEICLDDRMPVRQKVYEWMAKDDDFSGRIARARKDGAHAIARRLRETARGRGESTKDIARDKLIIDTDLKLLSKWFPKDYGDKLDLSATITGDIRVVVGGDAS